MRTKSGYQRPAEALCWTCTNATPLLCEWVQNAIRGNVPGHVTAVVEKESKAVCSLDKGLKVITGCNRYEYGRLPRATQLVGTEDKAG